MNTSADHQQKNRTLKLFGIAASIAVLIVFLVLVFVPALCCDGDRAERLRRRASLRAVASGIHSYADSSNDGVYPSQGEYRAALFTISDVWPEPIFGSDETQDDIWMCPISWRDRKMPSDITSEQLAQLPMMHFRVDADPEGTSVAFWDSSVRYLTNEEFEAIIDVEQSTCLACEMSLPNLMKRSEP